MAEHPFSVLRGDGVPKDKIELWHQEIDARGATFFDWEITPDYCRKFAQAFGVKIYFQWKEGEFYRELMRENSLTAPNHFQQPDGTIGKAGGKKGKLTTRHKFPQCSHNLMVRWCSPYLKIDVCKAAIINQPRFRGIRTLILSGERGEESPARAKYAIIEPDSSDRRNGKKIIRHVDRFRPLRDWREKQIWQIIERYRIRVHPCYYLGFSRCSCRFCIFGNCHQFASAAYIAPAKIAWIIQLEKDFNYTVKPGITLPTLIARGIPYKTITEDLKALATSYKYSLSIIFSENQKWILPAGAYGEPLCNVA